MAGPVLAHDGKDRGSPEESGFYNSALLSLTVVGSFKSGPSHFHPCPPSSTGMVGLDASG